MLVVIGIIMILIAILIPVLTTAEDRANTVKCRSNVHQAATAAIRLFDESGGFLPARSAFDQFGEAAEKLLPYLKNQIEIFDCPANPGNDAYAFCQFKSHEGYSDYESNGYMCNAPGSARKQNAIVDFSTLAYIYDYPYHPNDQNRAHEDGINVGYLDGHAAWLPFADMGTLTDPNDCTTFFLKGHTLNALCANGGM
jgi:prepilin-type processing-associated H-X9-DG protein